MMGIALLAPTSARAQELTGAEYYRLRQQADSLFRAVDIAGTITILNRLLAHDDRDGELWQRLARAYEMQQKRPEAIAAFQNVIRVGYEYTPGYLFAIARLYGQQNQRDSAVAYVRQALEGHFVGRERLRTDDAFASMREDPEFRKLAGFPPANLTRDQRWQFDLDYLVEEAKRLHGAPERFAFRKEFDDAAAALRRDIPRLDDETIIARLRGLLVQLDDGHTGAFFENAMRAPIGLQWFRDGIFITRDLTTAAEPTVPGDTTLLGSKVVAVEGVPVMDAVRRVSSFITRDHEMGVRAVAPFDLAHRPILKGAQLLRDTIALSLTLQTRNGRSRTVSIPFARANTFADRLNRPPGDSASRPMYMQRVNTAYWMKPLPEANAVYMQFNAVRNDAQNPLPQFAKRLTQVLDSTRAKTLIVDLRHNGGGNSYLFPPFIKSMIVFKEKSPDHQVFVITSRNTFSAAQNFATAIDQWVGATFVGEPSGSRANFVGESSAFQLPATGTRANISWRWHQYSQWVDHRKWLAPKIPAEMTSADWFGGRDPALEAIVEVLRPAKGDQLKATS
ncbi:MAG TPA: hypothetical protein VGC44_06825 [Longimicrobiales bacterium]